MKKIISVIMSVIMILAVHIPISHAEDEDIKVIVDGVELQFDVAPVMENNHVLVPVRVIAEALNKTVTWNEMNQWQRVTIWGEYGDYYVGMTIGESTMEKNVINTSTKPGAAWAGATHTVELDVATRIIKDRTFVPLRAVSEAFNADVQWDDETRTVTITSSAEPDDSEERLNYWIISAIIY
ncbi:MAG: copper amine oxidase N-terminal domain-containing protein [Oscillospiraceae bacterium]|nr:copper amine oxidase N-terminal domain-containing protein [Oscillospiraceae bacterium]